MDPHSQHIRDQKTSIINTIENSSHDISFANSIREKIFSSDPWDSSILSLYSNGYPLPSRPENLKDSQNSNLVLLLNQRKAAVLRRYIIWKSLRPSLEKIRPITFSFFYPIQNNIIFDFSQSSNPIHLSLLFFQMLISYIPIFNIYQYDPIPGTGYKYYSGEKFILYYINNSMNSSQKFRTADAANQGPYSNLESQKKRDLNLSPIFKFIIVTSPWNGLPSWFRVRPALYSPIDSSDSSSRASDFNLDLKLAIFEAYTGTPYHLYFNQKRLDTIKWYGYQPWPYHL